MEETGNSLNPLKVFKDAWNAWTKNFIPVFALSCVTLFLGRLLYLGQRSCNFFPSVWPGDAWAWLATGLSLLLLLGVLVLMFANSLIALMIFTYVRPGRQGKPSFAASFQEAATRVAPYFKTLFLWAVFVAVLREGSRVLDFAGKTWAAAQPSLSGKTAVLIATGTPAVILLIAAAWYGFAFSLAPLLAAFEKKAPLAAFWESRSRVRGRALRYLCSMLLAVALYMAAGLAAYHVVTLFTDQRVILNAIDPVVRAVFGPFILTVWLMNYLNLRELNT